MNGTLPLFQDLEAPPAGASQRPPGPKAQRAGGRPAASDDGHLRAAWRLSRSMWRFSEGSPEETRAGLAICRHLQALLAQADHQHPLA